MKRKEIVLDSIKTVWILTTGLSLMAEPREDLSELALALYYLVVMGNFIVVWSYFARHDLPRWVERISRKNESK